MQLHKFDIRHRTRMGYMRYYCLRRGTLTMLVNMLMVSYIFYISFATNGTSKLPDSDDDVDDGDGDGAVEPQAPNMPVHPVEREVNNDQVDQRVAGAAVPVGVGVPINRRRAVDMFKRLIDDPNAKAADNNNNDNNIDQDQEDKLVKAKDPIDNEAMAMEKVVDYNMYNEETDEKRKRIRAIINTHDNIKDYEKIMHNGAFAKGITIDPRDFTDDEMRKYNDGWKLHSFNNFFSSLIPLNRTLPDVRLPACKNEEFPADLPIASVIICFHNEAWTTLMRTIFSVMNRTPPLLLREVLLIDDFSTFDHLGDALDAYVKNRFGFRVKVIRNSRREGLIRSRMIGANIATGEALVFLDSHVEVADDWLEPLLHEIRKSESTVASPMVDLIDKETFEYKYNVNEVFGVGGFDWNMQFGWHALPESQRLGRKHAHEPAKTPVMTSGMFAISKKYFEYIGSFDGAMEMWGGENIEMSLRVWMCGGRIMVVPCSHIGHVFRDRSPFEDDAIVRKNSIRTAEVWLDNYKDIFFQRLNNKLGHYGDVTERKKLREELKCQSFQWYVNNVWPEMWIPSESIHAGPIINKETCLDSPASRSTLITVVQAKTCNSRISQIWYYSKTGEIRRDQACIDFAGGADSEGKADTIVTYPCHGEKGNQEWVVNESKQIVHKVTGFCIQVNEPNALVVAKCNANDPKQIWSWDWIRE